MQNLDAGHIQQWSLGWLIGSKHPFFNLESEVLISTWLVLAGLLFIFLPIRWILTRTDSVARFLAISYVQSFINTVKQNLGKLSFAHLCFVMSLFIFIFSCNLISFIPTLSIDHPSFEEPTKNINTTLALGLTAFIYIQVISIRSLGIWQYFKGYFSPIFIMFPLNVIGKLATVISLSFRLFGNIYGGAIITTLYFKAIQQLWYAEIIGIITGSNFIIRGFFGLFEGYIQAFVFSMLTLTYISIASRSDDDDH